MYLTHAFKAGLWLTLAGMIAALALTGCNSKATDESQILVVERRYVKLEGVSPNGWDFAEFVVDVPIKGFQSFFNDKLILHFKSV